MSIPPGSLITEIDFLDPACFTNGGTSVTDLSGSGNNWTLQNTSYTYNATFGSIALPVGTKFSSDNGTLFGTGVVPFTVSMWHYATASSQSIFYNGCFPGSGYFGPQSYWNGSNLIYRVNTAPGAIDTSTVSINTWHMFTVEYDGTTLKIYIDGVYATGATRSIDQQGSIPYPGIQFNNEYDNSGVSPLALINIYDVAIGAGDITTLYNDTKGRFAVVASYDFSDPACYPGTGNTVFDLTANNLDLPIFGATFVSDGQASHFSFDGSNDHIGKNGVTGLGNTFSVSLWSKYPAAATSQMYQFSAGTYDPAQGAGPMNGVNAPSTGFVDISFNDGIGLTSFSTSPDVWHNYTFTVDGTTVKAYLDGTLAASASQGIGSWDTGGLYLGVPLTTGGNYYPGFYYNGKIAILDVYNVALGSTAVLDNYNSQAPRFDNLIYSYDFSDPACYSGSGSTVFDLSGSELDLPIVNATFGGTGQSKYFEFSGSSSYIGLPSGVAGLGTSFSLSIWSQTSVTSSSNQVLFTAGSDPPASSAPAFYYNLPTVGEISASFNYGTGLITEPYVLNTWENYIYTADGTTAKLYKNGVLEGSVSQGSGNWPTGWFYLGYTVDSLVGKIATFDVYNSALGSTAISTYYNSTSSRFGVAPPPAYVGIVGGRQFAQGFNG
jgi:hypothetical protein